MPRVSDPVVFTRICGILFLLEVQCAHKERILLFHCVASVKGNESTHFHCAASVKGIERTDMKHNLKKVLLEVVLTVPVHILRSTVFI